MIIEGGLRKKDYTHLVRKVPKRVTSEEVAGDVARFLSSGGRIEEVPAGVSAWRDKFSLRQEIQLARARANRVHRRQK